MTKPNKLSAICNSIRYCIYICGILTQIQIVCELISNKPNFSKYINIRSLFQKFTVHSFDIIIHSSVLKSALYTSNKVNIKAVLTLNLILILVLKRVLVRVIISGRINHERANNYKHIDFFNILDSVISRLSIK